MELWAEFVDLIYAVLLNLSMAFGGNMGMAIASLSLTFRVVLLPLTLRIAYRSVEAQVALKRIRPALERVRRRHKDDPQRLWEETARLHRQHGIRLFHGASFASTLLQVPLFVGVFSAVRRGLTNASRFLWIKDLSAPDAALAVACAIAAGISVALGPNFSEQPRWVTVALSAVLTLLFLVRMASGVAIYSFASSLAGMAQSFLVRRRFRQLTA